MSLWPNLQRSDRAYNILVHKHLQFLGNILRKAIITENANKPSKDAEISNLKQVKNHRQDTRRKNYSNKEVSI